MKTRFAMLMGVALAAILSLAAPLSAFAQPTDHLTCYKAKTTSDTPKFVAIPGVSLVDQFRSSTVEVKKPKLLCAPTNKNGEDPTAPAHPDHLEDYQIKPTIKFAGAFNQQVVDQFGTHFYDLKKPVALQVPTAKSLTMPFPPDPANPAVDHFTCYKVKTTSNTPKFVRQDGVTIQDQFGSMTVSVLKARRLCAPTNKNNEEPGAEDHLDHLMCYKIKQTSLPKFVTVTPLFLGNQFGTGTRDAKKPVELCVPAAKNPQPTPTATTTPPPTPTATPTFVPDCGNGVVQPPAEQCDPNAPPGPPGICDPSQCVPLGASTGDAFACTCGTGQIRVHYNNGVLDSGWTGTSHDTKTVDNTDFDGLLFDCDGVLDNDCRVTGPRTGEFGFRCELNARIHCDNNADCAPLNGRCGGFLGAPLPLSSGGVPVCVTTFFPRPITGTINVMDGSSETFTYLQSRVHLATAIDAPCARCNCTGVGCLNQVGDAGTCSGGSAAGQACTIEGTSVFGPMSRDCPPENGANVSGQGLDVRFLPTTTGTSTKTATLPCTAAGNTQYNTCACDTCGGGDTPAAPCASNADCPGGGVCGSLRCVGGANDGQICAVQADCALPGQCSRPGVLTKPNDCELGCSGGPTPGMACAVDADCGTGGTCIPLCAQIPGEQIGMGQCVIGPVDGKCANEPFRGCQVDAECNGPPPPLGPCVTGAGTCSTCTMCNQTCQFTLRPCHVFPMQLQGTANPYVLNDTNGESVTAFCIPPTSSPAVNTTAGLPGEGAITVDHTITKKFPSDACNVPCGGGLCCP